LLQLPSVLFNELPYGFPAYLCITMPPSTLIVWPVTFFARFDARNTTIAAKSSCSC
jgi:hypothetical protein